MQTTDYFFTSIKPAPIVVTRPTAHHNKPTEQQAATQDPVSQQTHPLRPGKTRVYPSMLTLPSLFTYIYVTFTFPMEGQFKVYLQFVHSSVLRVYIYV